MNTLAVDNVGSKTRQSVKWAFALQIIQKIIFFAGSVILARLLTPQDFGIATILITLDIIIWIMMSLGIGTAIVHYQDNIDERLNATFWMFLIFSSFASILIAMISPYIAHFYNEPKLVNIIRVNVIAVFIMCLGATHRTILIKNLEFKNLSILECSVNTAKSILYILFAIAGFGVWSFIWPKLITALVSVPILWKLSGWVPKPELNFGYWKQMFNYSKNILFSSMIDYFLNNSSYILIGSLIGSASLGIYTFAYDKSMMIVNNITYPMMLISFPAFSKLQDHHNRLKDAYFKTIRLIALLTFPCAFGQLVLGEEYINAVFGSKWGPSIVIFQMLLLYSIVRSISQSGNPVLQGIGKPHIVLKCNLIYAPIFLTSLYIGYKLGGIYGIGAACALVGSIWGMVYLFIVVRELDWSVKDLIDILRPALVSSMIMAAAIFPLRMFLDHENTSRLIILTSITPIGILTYFLAIKIFFNDTYEFIIDNFVKFLGKRKTEVKYAAEEQNIEEA